MRGRDSDFWAVLGVAPGAGAAEIRAALRRRARDLHPDRHPGDPGAEERFKGVVRAYERAVAAAQGRPWPGRRVHRAAPGPWAACAPPHPHRCAACGDGIAFPGTCARCDAPLGTIAAPPWWLGPAFLGLGLLIVLGDVRPAGVGVLLGCFGALVAALGLHDRASRPAWR